jgi:Cu(I)/Ag(I) efflux system protein CusF
MKKIHVFVSAAAIVFTSSVGAQQGSTDHSAHHPAASASTANGPLSEGEVRKVDLELGKLTLRHGPLVNLDMPAMTMVFTAADKKLLDGLKEGDKVKFTADKQNGVYVLTAIEAAK